MLCSVCSYALESELRAVHRGWGWWNAAWEAGRRLRERNGDGGEGGPSLELEDRGSIGTQEEEGGGRREFPFLGRSVGLSLAFPISG